MQLEFVIIMDHIFQKITNQLKYNNEYYCIIERDLLWYIIYYIYLASWILKIITILIMNLKAVACNQSIAYEISLNLEMDTEVLNEGRNLWVINKTAAKKKGHHPIILCHFTKKCL